MGFKMDEGKSAEVIPFRARKAAREETRERTSEFADDAQAIVRQFLAAKGNKSLLLQASRRLEPMMRRFEQARVADDVDALASIDWIFTAVIGPRCESEGWNNALGYIAIVLAEVRRHLDDRVAKRGNAPN